MSDIFLPDASFAREYKRIVRKLDNISGPGVTNTPENIVINPPPSPPSARRVVPDDGEFDARITAVSGSFPAWTYIVQAITGYDSTLTGYLQWKVDGVNKTAVNGSEFGPQSGYPYTYGNGVTITASDGTVNSGSCKIIAIGIGRVVRVKAYGNQTGVVVYRFVADNSAQ